MMLMVNEILKLRYFKDLFKRNEYFIRDCMYYVGFLELLSFYFFVYK